MRDGRRTDQLRALDVAIDYLEQPHGAVLWSQGKTIVLCTASIEEGVPRWLRNSGRGWMTAEYSLLPASTGDRVDREASRGKQQGRTIEIQRLIGRALRAVVDFRALGERTLWLDCDVLQADGGTRCAAISGAYVAGKRALDRFGLSRTFTDSLAAVSVGVVDGTPLLDLEWAELIRTPTFSHAAASRSETATCSTLAIGSCRNLAPMSTNDDGSPVVRKR